MKYLPNSALAFIGQNKTDILLVFWEDIRTEGNLLLRFSDLYILRCCYF